MNDMDQSGIPAPPSPVSTKRRFRPPGGVLPEMVVVLAVFVMGAIVGSNGVDAFIKAGNKPFFYQGWFGAAVMEACGRGFQEPPASELPPRVRAFLDRQIDGVDCAELPANLTPGPANHFLYLYRYLELTLVLIWRVRGVSWANLDVLYAAMSGVVAALTYGLLRLGVGRLIAVAGAFALVSSPLHLANLPHLRDYLKAPFQMALILAMGCVVLYGTSRRRVLALACAGGVVLGVGLGFRPDLLLGATPMALALVAFLPMPWRGTLGLRAMAVVVFVVTTLVAGAPIIAAYETGGNAPHVALLGFADPFTDTLGLRQNDYSALPLYSDRNAEMIVRTDVVRRQGGAAYVTMNMPEYDRAMSDYVGRVVRQLPADVVARAYAAILKIFESPFDIEGADDCVRVGGTPDSFCGQRVARLSPHLGIGAPLGLLALAGLIAGAPRVGLFALIVVAFFAGGAALQFNERHYFYLEFLPWWAFAFLLQRSAGAVWRLARSDRRAAFARLWRWERAGLITLAAVSAGVVLVLVAARFYQQRTVTGLLTQYRRAPVSPLAVRWVPIAPGRVRAEVDDERLALDEKGWRARTIGTELFRVDFGGAGCDYALIATTLRYTTVNPYDDPSTAFPIRMSRQGEIVSAFFPAYAAFLTTSPTGNPYGSTRFTGVEMSEAQARCLVGFQRVLDPFALPFLWQGVVRPRGDAPPQYYQTFVRWESRGESAAAPRLYSSASAGVTYRDLTTPMPSLRQTLDRSAPEVTFEGDRAIVNGPVSSRWTTLLRATLRTVPAGARAVIQGRLDGGEIIFALFDGKQYVQPFDIAQPGPFAIALDAPAAGAYHLVVMTNDRSQFGTRLQVDRFGWVPDPPGPAPTHD